MAITFVSSSNTTYASRTNTTITAPANIQDGDVLILTMITAAASSSPTPSVWPAGFVQIGSVISVTDAGGYNMQVWHWRKVASGESGNYTITHASCTSQGAIQVWRGVDATTPEDVTSTANKWTSGATTTTTWTGLTTVTNGAMIVANGTDWADNTNNLSPPTSMTERNSM